MEGQDLTVFVDGGEPQQKREYFTAGYHDHSWARDKDYAMFAKNDGSEAKLFDVRADPEMNKNLAGSRPEVVNNMWNDYVLKDAGGPIPS